MKKFISLLLVCLMVVPFGMLATLSATADLFVPKTVYVQEGAAGDGTSAASPLGTLEAAYAALGDEGGEIVIIGTYNLNAYFKAPDHTGEVIIMGADASAKIATAIAEVRFFTGGPTVFTDITLETVTGSLLLVYQYHDFAITDTVVHEKKKDAMIVASQGGNAAKPSYNFTPKSCIVSIEGGYWNEVSFGPRQSFAYVEGGEVLTKPAEEFKDIEVTAYIGGDAVISKLFVAERSYTKSFLMEGSTASVILDGGQIDSFMGLNDNKTVTTGYLGGFVVYITENFDMSKSFENHGKPIDANRMNGGIFYGLSGENIFNNETISYTKLNNSTLVIDDAVYDAVMNSGKIYAGSFANTLKTSELFPDEPDDTTEPEDTTVIPEDTTPAETEPAETEPAETEPAQTEPAQTEPAETEKPGTGDAPETGDGAWAIAVVAAIAVMGCAVITASKKKAE